jgi:hypothetical protein
MGTPETRPLTQQDLGIAAACARRTLVTVVKYVYAIRMRMVDARHTCASYMRVIHAPRPDVRSPRMRATHRTTP